MKAGYVLFKCDKVENMLVGIHNGYNFCKGRVAPSMKKARYATMAKLSGDSVVASYCSCPAGKGKCKHTVALLYALVDHLMSGRDTIPESIACTSQPRQWGRVTAKPVNAETFRSFSELVPKTVNHDPDHPERAAKQSYKAESCLQFSCLPASTSLLHISRLDILTEHHPFWARICSHHDDGQGTSAVKREPKNQQIECEDADEPITLPLNSEPIKISGYEK